MTTVFYLLRWAFLSDTNNQISITFDIIIINKFMTINLFHSGYLQTGTLTNSEDPDDACNGPSLNSEIDSIFTVAMVKKWLPNRLKIGK